MSFSPNQSPRELKTNVVLRPSDLTPADIEGRTVVVFDVLRATTSITAALAAGVPEIRIFPDIQSASQAAHAFGSASLLCGEVQCLRPPGFDLGNSPTAFQRNQHAKITAFLATTNGTRAIIAARKAPTVLIGALVNASAVATRLAELNRDVTLLCAGTDGQIAMEDAIGAGAVLEALMRIAPAIPATDAARIALRLFASAKHDLPKALRDSGGGRNLIAAGLECDIDFCAKLDALNIVGEVHDTPLRVSATSAGFAAVPPEI